MPIFRRQIAKRFWLSSKTRNRRRYEVDYPGAAIFALPQAPQAPQAPPTDTVAPSIPGVVAAGTKVEVIKDGFQGPKAPSPCLTAASSLPRRNANRITKIDKDNVVSVLSTTRRRG